jgi:hypothetical protein
MKNWLFEHLTFKIQHMVKCQSTLANLEKTKTKIHGKFGKYLCRMRNGISCFIYAKRYGKVHLQIMKFQSTYP